MIVSPASRMLSAISFGVFCRSAPSTSAIMRSRKVSPGFDVIFTRIWSDSTRVPPVTAERSPPASRMTGADSPVIADSSTDATPSMISPSAGMNSPAETMTTSPARSFELATCSMSPSCANAVGDGFGARLAQRVGLRLAAAFGHRFGEVGEQHREPQPQRDLQVEPERRAAAEQQHRGDDAADLDHEHDGIAHHVPRIQLDERVQDRAPDDLPFPNCFLARLHRRVPQTHHLRLRSDFRFHRACHYRSLRMSCLLPSAGAQESVPGSAPGRRSARRR